MPTVNLTLTPSAAATGTVGSPEAIVSNNNQYATYQWASQSGLRSYRYTTDFSTAVPSGSTINAVTMRVRVYRTSANSVYPSYRWGTSGGSTTLADSELTASEVQYTYSGQPTAPSTWATIDIGMTKPASGTDTCYMDEWIVEVDYTAPVIASTPTMFMNENF